LRSALLPIALLLASPRARADIAEICTLPTGSYEWTAPCSVSAGSIEGCECAPGDPDRWLIPDGAQPSCPPGPSAADVELDFSHPEAEIVIERGGSLALAAGCALGVPGGGLHVRGALALQGELLSQGDAADVRLDEILHCPGSDDGLSLREDCEGAATALPGSRSQVALCWPDGSRADWLAAIRAGDVLAFRDPSAGAEPPRDVNAFYRIEESPQPAAASCLVANVLQGGDSAGYGIGKREILELALSSDYAAGQRTVAVGSGPILADKQGSARWLTCHALEQLPDGSQTGSGTYTQKITGVEDDPAGDTLELLPGGFPVDLPAGTTCYLDYGWMRGDAIAVWRPAGLGDGTPAELSDSRVECERGAQCDFDFALLANRAPLTLFAASDLDDSWIIDATSSSVGLVLHLVDWTGANVSERVQITSHSDGRAHSVSIDGEGFEGGTLIDWHIRHSEDDMIIPNNCFVSGDVCVPGPGEIRDQLVVLRRLRVGYMGCTGGSCAIIDSNGDDSAFHVDLDGLLAEDPGGEEKVASSFYQGGSGVWRLRNLTFVAADYGLFEDFGTSEQNVSLENVYDIGRDGGSFGSEVLAAIHDLSDVSLIDLRLPRESALLRFNWQLGAAWRRILVLDPRNNYPWFLFLRDAGAPVSIRDLAIVGAGLTQEGVGGFALAVRRSQEASAPMLLENVTLALRPGQRSAHTGAILYEGDGAPFSSRQVLRGLLVANFAGTPEGTPASLLASDNADGLADVCMQDNERDGNPFPEAAIGGTVLRDAGLRFADAQLGNFRLGPRSPGHGICGARAPGAYDMWALRVLHHDPHRFGDSWKPPAGCGDGLVGAGEECDDGAHREQDGCSAYCQGESSLSLFGLAQGGLVQLEVDGQAVEIATEAGQTTPQIIEALAARIALLGLPGVSAVAAAETLWTTAEISAVALTDPGLTTAPAQKIPLLPATWLALLALLLLVCVARSTGGPAMRERPRTGTGRTQRASGSSSSQLR
jgi:cysteine-rich repeat protein